jgi:hypothetical protein
MRSALNWSSYMRSLGVALGLLMGVSVDAAVGFCAG